MSDSKGKKVPRYIIYYWRGRKGCSGERIESRGAIASWKVLSENLLSMRLCAPRLYDERENSSRGGQLKRVISDFSRESHACGLVILLDSSPSTSTSGCRSGGSVAGGVRFGAPFGGPVNHDATSLSSPSEQSIEDARHPSGTATCYNPTQTAQ